MNHEYSTNGFPEHDQEGTGLPERILSEKEREERLESATEEALRLALATIKERFERSSRPEDNLDFHNTRHTKDVLRRYDAIMEVVRTNFPQLFDQHMTNMGRLGAAYHDTIQEWEPVEVTSDDPDDAGLTKIIRKRHVGENESASTAELRAVMEQVNKEAKGEVFTAQDMEVIRAGHDATVPGFDPERGTVTQPRLSESSSIVTRAIALADLGTAGMDGPEAFLPEGNALFREENLDITESLAHPERLTDAQKAFYRKRMLAWSAFQGRFAEGRKALLEEELKPLPKELQETIAGLFGKFDDSIVAAHEQAQRRTTLSFEALAEDMGYRMKDNEQEGA